MNAKSVAAIAASLLLCGAEAASAQSDMQAAYVAKGREIAAARCGRCHALGMADASAHPQAPPFRHVVERFPSENLAEALAEGIMSGHPDMPVFVFQPPEIEAFLAYLDSLGPADAKARK